MRKGQRPSRHYRIVRTKKGRRRIRINPSIKKVKKIKRRRSKLSEGFMEKMRIQTKIRERERDLEREKRKKNGHSIFIRGGA